jgi:hypothetical protein
MRQSIKNLFSGRQKLIIESYMTVYSIVFTKVKVMKR